MRPPGRPPVIYPQRVVEDISPSQVAGKPLRVKLEVVNSTHRSSLPRDLCSIQIAAQVWNRCCHGRVASGHRRANCDVVFLQRPTMDDPNDQPLLQNQGAIAEYERAVLAERFPCGRLQKARDGHILSGKAPLRLPLRAGMRRRPGPSGR